MNTLKLLFSFCPRWERSALAKKANALLVPAPWSLCVCLSDGIRSLVPPLIGPPSHWSPSHWSPNSLVPQYTIGTHWSPISLVPSLNGPRCMRWSHPSLFHRVPCRGYISHRLIWMKSITCFLRMCYLVRTGIFIVELFPFIAKPYCSDICGYHKCPQTLAEI